ELIRAESDSEPSPLLGSKVTDNGVGPTRQLPVVLYAILPQQQGRRKTWLAESLRHHPHRIALQYRNCGLKAVAFAVILQPLTAHRHLIGFAHAGALAQAHLPANVRKARFACARA